MRFPFRLKTIFQFLQFAPTLFLASVIGDANQTSEGETLETPQIVSPATHVGGAPGDAVVLLDGNDLSKSFTGGEKWRRGEGFVTVAGPAKYIETKASFGDCQLHVEFATPASGNGKGQHRGNSGIYFMGLYEIQILDSIGNETYADGQCGAIYKQKPPLVNASRERGQWQSYDICFIAPRFDDDGTLLSPASITAFQNGVLIQANTKFRGPTDLREKTKYTKHASKLPLRIQNHRCPVKFRNIWIRNLEGGEPATDLTNNIRPTSEWTFLLDSKLSKWEKFLGAPHPSIERLPKGIPTSEDFKVGTPIGLQDMLDVFTVKMEANEPVVRISGEVYGALTTLEEFSDYQLQMEFRWGNKKFIPRLKLPRESGLLYHCVGAHGAYASSWMTSLECQIMEQDYGDLFCLGDCSAKLLVKPYGEKEKIFSPLGEEARMKKAKRLKDNGKPHDWNVAEVYVIGDRAIHVINGEVVMAIRDARLGQRDNGTPMTKGKIQIQSEGAEMFVRRVKIRGIESFPPRLLSSIGYDQRLNPTSRESN